MGLQICLVLSCTIVAVLQVHGQTSAQGFAVSVGDWRECRRINSSSVCYKQRSASCVRVSDNLTAPWYYCENNGTERVSETEMCPEEQCAQDCVVCMWSEWTTCNCSLSMHRSRYREVVLPPKNGGESCPSLIENATCDTCPYTLDTLPRSYTWRTGRWGACEPLNRSSTCGYGLQSRAVGCVDLERRIVSSTYCLSEAAYARVVPPSSKRLCEVPCPCMLSAWTPWSACEPSCDGATPSGVRHRTRIILQLPTMNETLCPATKTSESCVLHHTACPGYAWKTSGWSVCTFQNGGTCGAGLRSRFVYCLQNFTNGSTYSQTVELEKCNSHIAEPRPSQLESCEVSCPRDCVVGSWSDWSLCSETCSQSNIINRTREVIFPPLGSGRQCLYLVEFKCCPTVSCIRWVTEGFSPCIIQGASCGEGSQSRSIFCRDEQGSNLDFESCPDPMPVRSRSCYIPCRNECVISEWSDWSTCSATCAGNIGTQTRTRRFLAAGLSCRYGNANLTETHNCTTNVPCNNPVYHIQVGSWGACHRPIVNSSSSSTPVCGGVGVQNRTAACLKDNTVITSGECPIEFQAVETRICNLSCAADCIFSEWMAYSSCSATCGTGHRTRSRLLLQFSDTTRNSNCGVGRNGLQIETQACNLPTCPPTSSLADYSWHTEPWSPCYVLPTKLSQHSSSSSCGYGYQNRSTSCRSRNNQVVAEQFCINSSKPSSYRTCVIPCADHCIVSDWSEFGSCQNGNVSRTREIVAFSGSTDLGRNCPELASIATTEAVSCSQVDNREYVWVSYSYSECIIESSSNEICGSGLQYRRIACVAVDDNSPLPVSEEYCPPPPPSNTRPCATTCQIDCQLSEWSQWSDCSATCGQGYKTRTRTVRRPQQPRGRLCGPLYETTICSSPSCKFAEYRPSPFGLCEMLNTSAICGPGTQQREPICVVNGVTQSDNTSCAHSEVSFHTQKPCNFPCPGVCVLGAWEPWSTCTGTQRRTRPKLREGTGCADSILTQTRSCSQSAITYLWYAEPWKDCIIPALGNADYCGNGTQGRIVKCINAGMNETVFEGHCEHLPKLSDIQTCNIPCPVDCKVSNFSLWTECFNTCDVSTNQSRWRHVFVNDSNGGQGCPDLLQEKPCLVRNCAKFAVEAYQSRCSPEYTNTSMCGSVSIAKQVTCLKNKRSVSLSECVTAVRNGTEVVSLENLNSVEEYCHRQCPTELNCSFSEWSEWSPCSCTCYQSNGQAFSFRFRRLLKALLSYRNECLKQQYEVQLCEVTQNGNTSGVIVGNSSCIEFNWQTSEWYQNQTRAVWCQSGIGTKVSQSGCIKAIKPVAQMGRCRTMCAEFSSCNADTGNCQCSPSFEQVGSVCLPTRGCLVDGHCLYPNMVCGGTQLACVCKEGWEMRVGESQCAGSCVYVYVCVCVCVCGGGGGGGVGG